MEFREDLPKENSSETIRISNRIPKENRSGAAPQKNAHFL